MIPIFSPTPQYRQLKDSLDSALLEAAAAGQYILGPQVQAFEDAFARETGAAHAIGLNSGTDALLLALRALDIGPGDEVITTPFSYVATSEAIVRTGARPVFVDIDPESFNLNLDLLDTAVTERTKAVIPVHLFGYPVDMTKLIAWTKSKNLFVIEDCAQATGATWQGKPVGSFGEFGCFSFFPTKNLGAMGDAGAVTTNDPALADRVKALRVHGATPQNRYDHQESGINSRLDTLQAAVLLCKLPCLAEWNRQRQRIARRYTESIQNSRLSAVFTPPALPPAGLGEHVFHQYTVKVNTASPDVRECLQAELRECDVMAMIYYPIPLHLQRTHAALGYRPSDLPVCEAVAAQVLSLPIYPGMTPEEQDVVIAGLHRVSEQIVLPR